MISRWMSLRENWREMLTMLREQNSRLMQQIHQLSRGKGSSAASGMSWDAVTEGTTQTGGVEAPGSPRGQRTTSKEVMDR